MNKPKTMCQLKGCHRLIDIEIHETFPEHVEYFCTPHYLDFVVALADLVTKDYSKAKEVLEVK